MDYGYTRIWKVEHKLIIADTIEEAIEVYKTWAKSMGGVISADITKIKAIGDSQIPENFDALIKKGIVEDLFPELKESENKRKGKSALEAIKEEKVDNANKIEPKFYKGEWLCENEPNNYARFIQILEIVNVQGKERYRISRDIHNDKDVVEFDFVEKYYHKFDIKDAKDGDVLSYRNGQWIFILKRVIDKDCFEYYTIWSTTHNDLTTNDSAFSLLLINSIYPATKEQRDLLFQKMKEKGWEWDAEKKELRKIDSFCQEHCKGYQETGRCFSDGDCEAKIKAETETTESEIKGKERGISSNSSWSEQDEEMLESIITEIKANQQESENLIGNYESDVYNRMIDWLKSLKERIGG